MKSLRLSLVAQREGDAGDVRLEASRGLVAN